MRAPEIEEIEIEAFEGPDGEEGGWRITARARPGEEDIPSEDLLYFWKLGPREVRYRPGGYRAGARVTIDRAERPDALWLLVSDRRGGERWEEVNLDAR